MEDKETDKRTKNYLNGEVGTVIGKMALRKQMSKKRRVGLG